MLTNNNSKAVNEFQAVQNNSIIHERMEKICKILE